MERRAFLRALLSGSVGAAAAHTFDLDKLLWVPGAKTFFLPSPRVGNTFLTTQIITREALKILENQLTVARAINRPYRDNFLVSGARVGNTITIHTPPRYQFR